MAKPKASVVPMFDRVLIKREKFAKTNSLLIIPKKVEKNNAPSRGIVVSVGPTAGTYDRNGNKVESVTVGMKVIFAKHAGVEVTLGEDEDTVEYWLVQDEDILCKIEGDE